MGAKSQSRQILPKTLRTLTNKQLSCRSVHCSEMPLIGESSEYLRKSNTPDQSSSPALDSQIWSRLQPELVARILAHLPLTALVQTRLLNKKWDREIYSGGLLGHDEYSTHPISRSWLILFENGFPGSPYKLQAFDPAQNDWQTFTTAPHFATAQKIGGLVLCCAASGLMVFKISAVKSHFIRFGVFNPITRSWKKLSPLLNRRQGPVVSMFTERSSGSSKFGTGHYKLVVAGGLEYDQQVQTTEIYDSRAECWRIACDKFNNQQSHVCDEMRTSTAFCEGAVYHMRFNRILSFDPSRELHTFVMYDTKNSRWRPLRVPLPPDLVFTEYPSIKRVWKGRSHLADVLPPSLVESNGRLLLVGFREDRALSTIAGIGVWELSQRKAWKLVTMMPETLFNQMSPTVCTSAYIDPSWYLKYELQSAGHGDMVYIFQPNGGQGFVALCDFSQSPPAWRLVRNGFVPKSECSQNLHGCVIDLRLDTLI